MKDFFEQQDQARRRTRQLVAIFGAAIAVNVVSIALVAAPVIRLFTGRWWNPIPLGWVAFFTALFVALAIWDARRRLARGGHFIARKLGGRKLSPSSKDIGERTLLNVIEEMAIASSCPVPPVYVLDRELGINAFAAGNDADDAVIAVTKGALAHLDRDELQGIVAHEFSHILNGDMRLNQRLVAVLSGVGLIPDFGFKMLDPLGLEGADTEQLFTAMARNADGGGVVLLLALFVSAIVGCALVVVGSIGLFAGRWIKGMISYQREFHADAAAVQFTRNPDGLSSALQKIGGLPRGSRLRVAAAEAVSHMMFSGNRVSGGSTTHPPLPDRIRRVDSRWDGKFPEVQSLKRMPSPPPERPTDATPLAPLPDDAHGEGALTPAMALTGRGGASADDWFRRRAPKALRKAVEHPLGARAALCALLLDERPEVYGEQLKILARVGPQLQQYAEELSAAMRPLGRGLAFAVVDRALPALLEMSDIEYRELKRLVGDLVAADGRVDLFEYSLKKWIVRRLGEHFERTRPAAEQYSLGALENDIDVVLSAMVHVGGGSEGSMLRAYRECLRCEPRALLRPEQCGLDRIDAAMHRLEFAYVNAKLRVMRACAMCIEQDGLVTVGELCLLRAIAEGIHAPPPPLIGALKESGSAVPRFDNTLRLTPLMLGAAVATPGVAQLGYAEQLLAALSEGLRDSIRDPFGACAATIALVLVDDEEQRAAQLAKLDEATKLEVGLLRPQLETLGRAASLPLAELCLPALRELTREQYDTYRAQLKDAIRAGGEVGLFEFALHRMVRHHLRRHFGGRRKKKPVEFISTRSVSDELSVLLSAIAREGSDDEVAIAEAFERGLKRLDLHDSPKRPQLLPPHSCELARVGEALKALDRASEAVRRRTLLGALDVVTADGVMTVGEGELLRVLADALDHPLPPLVGTLASTESREKACKVMLQVPADDQTA